MSTSGRILISADEVNCLIYSYFRDSGFKHSAFTLRSEAQLNLSPHANQHIPRGELVDLLSKALLYIETEKHWKGNFACKSGFSLLEPHVCDPQQPKSNPTPTNAQDKLTEQHPLNGESDATAPKRKASGASINEGHSEKRAKTEHNETSTELLEPVKAKPIEKKPFDITTIAGGPFTDQTTERRPPMPTDSETDPAAIQLLPGHFAEVFVCAWNPVNIDQLATGSKDATVNIWTLPWSKSRPTPGALGVLSLQRHFKRPDQGDLTALDWNPDGTLLAMGSYDSILRICTASGDLYLMDGQHEGPIFATRFSKSGRWLLTASLDGTACVWNIRDKILHMQYRCHADCCLDVDWLDENTFASCGADAMIHIMKLDKSKPVRTLTGHDNEINQIKGNSSRTRLASCSDDHTARIWNVGGLIGYTDNSNDPVIVLKGHRHSVSSIGWCPRPAHGTCELVATSSFDGTARLWDSTTGACLKTFSDHRRPVYALAFSPDGRWLATGSGDGYLHVYHVKDKERRWSWYAGSDKPGVFEIDWQITKKTNRIALALECRRVGVVDVTMVPALREQPLFTD